IASTAVSTLPKAVMTTTGKAAFWRLMVCRNSRPFIPGSLRSVRTRSMEFSRSSLRPVSASSAEKVVNPSSPRFNSSRRRILASSSTIRIAGMFASSSIPQISRDHQMSSLTHGSFVGGGWEKYYEMSAGARCAGFPRASRAIAGGIARSFDADRAVMSIDNFRNDGQPQADAAFFRGHKRVEDLFPQLRWNARTGVVNAQFDSLNATGIAHPRRRFPRLNAQHAAAGAHGVVGI